MRTRHTKEALLNLEQQKKQAREFLRAIRSGSADALSRLRKHHARWAEIGEGDIRHLASLRDAQFVLAREHGFPSWSKLKAYADPADQVRHTRIFVADVAWMMDRVHGLMRTRASAGPAALEQIREWHPRFADATDRQILDAPFSEEDARLVYAREHGFDTWADLVSRVEALAQSKDSRDEPFLAAFECLKSRDLARLQACLRTHPQVAKDRGTNGNTLLNLAISLSPKTHEGGYPSITALLEAGADVNEGNDRGWTPLHAAAYSNQSQLAALLIQNGAALDAEAHGAGGTPLIAALFWGHREVAFLIASHGITPRNLRAAAGLGDEELIEASFRDERTLLPEARAARGFYRPHSGFPDWTPSTGSQEILDEALVWACKSNRVAVLDRLVRAGARVNADPYRGTPLLWAAFCNRIEAAAWLLDHRADVNQKATFGGPNHGQGITALHLAAQCGHMPMVKYLVQRGADLSVKEDLYNSTPASAAAYFGKTAVRDYLQQQG